MARHNCFRNSTHADAIPSYTAEIAIFGWSFERRTLSAHIHAFNEANVVIDSYFLSLCYESVRIWFAHIRKTRSKFVVILSAKWIFWEKVYVVGNNHQVSNAEVRIHSASCIRHKQGLYAQFAHHSHREGDCLHIIAFVVVETSLHRHDILVAELTEDEFTAVTFNCRYREVWYLVIRYRYFYVDMIHEFAKTSAKNYGCLRHHFHLCC